jgi:phosphate transport system protein
MPRQNFVQKLQRVQDELLLLDSMVETALMESIDLLKRRDLAASRRLIAGDRWVKEKRFAIENGVLTLIATQQPMASDMRVLAAILEIATELERVGDYAKGIANINLMMGEGELPGAVAVDIPRMAEKARNMLHRALAAFIQRDVGLARAIAAEDDEVDDLYNQVYRKLVALIMTNPHTIDQATYLLWVAHNLERTADRVVNICERVVFTVTGVAKEMNLQPAEISR